MGFYVNYVILMCYNIMYGLYELDYVFSKGNVIIGGGIVRVEINGWFLGFESYFLDC